MALLSVIPGDIVPIPCLKGGDMGFVLSRVIRKDVTKWIEVFAEFYQDVAMSEDEVLAQDFSISNRLFNPVYASFDFNKFFGKIKWPILAHYPDYDPELHSKHSEIEFRDTTYDELGMYLKGRKVYYDPPHIRRNLEDRTIYSNPQLIHRVNLYVSGCLKKGTIWNFLLERKLLKKKGIEWWEEQIDQGVIIADTVGQKFKDARKKLKSSSSRKKSIAPKSTS